MVLSLDVDNEDADLDLKLYAKNPSGHECEVSPVNKYCAYSQHYKDNQIGESGSEVIKIKDLAVAEYKTTVEPSPAYGTTCPEYQLLSGNSRRVLSSLSGGWDWSVFKTTNPLNKISFYVKKLSKFMSSDTIQQVANSIGVNPPVETKPDAKKYKILLNQGGEVYSGEEEFSTYIEPNNADLVEVEIPEEEFEEVNEPMDSVISSDVSLTLFYFFLSRGC